MRIVTHKVAGGKVFGDNGGIVVGDLGCKQKIETKSFQVLVLNYRHDSISFGMRKVARPDDISERNSPTPDFVTGAWVSVPVPL